ncbi:MAG: MBL fold metallo-hydrolase [Deltaproteobacteria bacterium]|nr:MBL fold metallo-hydrolase [Deltaproteobacteria bacterium]
MIRIGKYDVSSVLFGNFRLDGGGMFGVVPKTLWEKTNPADAKNRILMALRGLLIRGMGRTILVDTGIGHHWDSKFIDRYTVDYSAYTLQASLEKQGVKFGDVTDVILSHLHFDHVGGVVQIDERGPALTFQNANHYVQRSQLNYAGAPSERDRASFFSKIIEPLCSHGKIQAMEGGFEMIPGVDVVVSHGHTPGQQMVKVSDGKLTVMYCGDTIPTASHIPLPYIASFDLEPMKTMEEKKIILEQAVRDKWILVWDHDPLASASTVRWSGGKFEKNQDVTL